MWMIKMSTGELTAGTKVTKRGNFVFKRTPLHHKWTPGILRSLVFEQHLKLGLAKIPVPNLRSVMVINDIMEIVMEYKGKPVKWGEHLDQIFKIVKTAENNSLYLDPHWKNFVIDDDGKVWYVDLTPPYSEDYAKQFKNKKLLNHIELFKPKNLMAHFIADLAKTNKAVDEIRKKEKQHKVI